MQAKHGVAARDAEPASHLRRGDHGLARDDTRLRHFAIAAAESEEAQHRCAGKAAAYECALAVAALDQALLGQKFERSAHGAQRHAMLGGEAGFGRQRRTRGPLARDDAVTQCRRKRRVPALPGFRLDEGETLRCHRSLY